MARVQKQQAKMPNLDMRTGKEKVVRQPRFMNPIGSAAWKHRPLYAERAGTGISEDSHDRIVNCVNFINSVRVSRSEEKVRKLTEFYHCDYLSHGQESKERDVNLQEMDCPQQQLSLWPFGPFHKRHLF